LAYVCPQGYGPHDAQDEFFIRLLQKNYRGSGIRQTAQITLYKDRPQIVISRE
jgi:hypothetical protein